MMNPWIGHRRQRSRLHALRDAVHALFSQLVARCQPGRSRRLDVPAYRAPAHHTRALSVAHFAPPPSTEALPLRRSSSTPESSWLPPTRPASSSGSTLPALPVVAQSPAQRLEMAP